MTTNTQPSKETAVPQLASQDVGLIFVREYYTFLNKRPSRLHAFYNKDSLLVRGDEGTASETIRGQEEIRKKIEECKFEDCKVLVTQVDSQTSANNGILIQVLGEMCNQNGPSQKFSQTFFLAPQPMGYYVLNDIFRFLKDEVEIDYYTCEEEEVKKETPVEEEVKEKEQEEEQQELKEEVTPTVSEEVKKTEVVNPTEVVKPTETDTVEEKKKKYENKQHKPKEQREQKEQQKPHVDKSAHVNNKPAAPKTWANLTAATPIVNGTPPTTTAATAPTAVPVEKTMAPPVTPTVPAVTATPAVEKTMKNRKEITQVFVKLVVDSISEEQLQEAFNQIGPVKSVNIMRLKNCAFVEFTSPEYCQKALSQHRVLVGNHTVLAEERRFNNNTNNRYNTNNQNRSQNNNTFERRSNNHRRGGSASRGATGKGRGVPTTPK